MRMRCENEKKLNICEEKVTEATIHWTKPHQLMQFNLQFVVVGFCLCEFGRCEFSAHLFVSLSLPFATSFEYSLVCRQTLRRYLPILMWNFNVLFLFFYCYSSVLLFHTSRENQRSEANCMHWNFVCATEKVVKPNKIQNFSDCVTETPNRDNRWIWYTNLRKVQRNHSQIREFDTIPIDSNIVFKTFCFVFLSFFFWFPFLFVRRVHLCKFYHLTEWRTWTTTTTKNKPRTWYIVCECISDALTKRLVHNFWNSQQYSDIHIHWNNRPTDRRVHWKVITNKKKEPNISRNIVFV